MKQIQHWFDRLVGVAAEEARLRHMARHLFDRAAPDFAALESPACWRRRARIGGQRPLGTRDGRRGS